MASECVYSRHIADDYDPSEPCPMAALRQARLKGSGPPTRQRVGLPPGWLQPEGDTDDDELVLVEDVCEG